jgi:PDZ domain-containing protein/TIR domain-containing protein
MPSVAPSVFISYRREDCPGHAGRLFDHLRARFGGASLFMDVTDIEAGVDFTDVLQRAVGSCDVLLAVVGREWLTCTDRNGRRRLDNPQDFIRLEIGIALARNVRVIPVLVEGAAMPTASELPSDLEGLAKRQAVELRDARWSADVDNLADVLDRVLGPRAAAIESSPPRLRPGRARIWALAALVLVAALVGVVTLVPRTGSAPSAPPQSTSAAPTVAEPRAPVEAQPATPSAPGPETQKTPAPQISPEREVRTDLAPSEPPPSPRPANGFLGVRMVDRAPGSSGGIPPGAIVQSLATGGPAANAGLLAGDLIVEYGGTAVKDAADFNRLTSASAPGDTVAIRLRRDGAVRTLQVVVGDRANAPGVMGTVSIHYASADDQEIAAELATALRETINDPRYAIRTLRISRNIGSEGEVRYSASRWSELAGTLARSAGASLSKTYGRRVVFAPLVDERVIPTSVIVVIPGRTPSPAAPLPDPIITVAYANPADAKTAEGLANFLRTLRSGWKYSVRTEQKASGPMAGHIEYNNERMGELARVLAREPSAWISRAYQRPIVLQPTSSERIRADLIILWLPSR